jgi:Family of unknown function (DUF5636)
MVHDMLDRTKIEIRSTLLMDEHFPQLKGDPFLEDFVALAAFLAVGQTNVDPHLIQLDNAMQKRAGTDGAWIPWIPWTRWSAEKYFAGWQDRAPVTWNSKTGYTNNPSPKPKNQAFSHLLTKELEAAELKAGFSLQMEADKRHVPTLVGALTAEQFNQQLIAGHHWKDAGVIARHGEFTHRIQWYLIVQAGVLIHPAREVFKAIGGHTPANPSKAYAGGLYLWDCLVDRGVWEATPPYFKTPHTNDFRSPEYLNDHLTSEAGAASFPLLGSFLRARKAKREAFDPEEYVSFKLFKKRFGALDSAQLKQVMEIASRSTGSGVLS